MIDAEKGPYKTIKEAIDAAEAGCEIRISNGLYQEKCCHQVYSLIQS